MNILGVGPWELILVAVLALIFIGPEKLPELMRQIGRTAGELRRMSSDLTAEFKEGLAPLQEVSNELTLTPKKEEKKADQKTQQPVTTTKTASSSAPTAAPEGLQPPQRSAAEPLAAKEAQEMAISPRVSPAPVGEAAAEPVKATPETAAAVTDAVIEGETQPAPAEETPATSSAATSAELPSSLPVE